MSDTITIDRAHFDIDEIFDGLSQGKSIVLTKDGEPVGRIEPTPKGKARQPEAVERLLARLEAQPVMNAGPWTREEMYEDD